MHKEIESIKRIIEEATRIEDKKDIEEDVEDFNTENKKDDEVVLLEKKEEYVTSDIDEVKKILGLVVDKEE